MRTKHGLSTKRMIDVMASVQDIGLEDTAKKFKVSMETINRYLRIHKEFIQPELPKILIFDIENAPVQAYVWNTQVWKAFVGHNQIEQDWFMLTYSAKWLYDNEVINNKLTPKEARACNDSRLVKDLWTLFDEADIVIAHNAAKFDIPMANTRFILNGLQPPSPYRFVDTLQVARQNFRFTHNKLDYLGELFGIGHKISTDFELWVRCMRGEKKALDEMSTYNEQDTLLLEEVYLKLRGWIKSHPNMNLFTKETGCANCGSTKVIQKGEYCTQVNKYMTFQCKNCGAFSRQTRKSLASVAR